MKYSGFDPQLKLAMAPQFAAHMAGEKVYPIGIEISPSGVCQASCDFCFYANTGELGNHRKVFLELQRSMGLLNECRKLGIKAVTWTGGGEPTLHPQFAALVDWAFANEIQQGLFTNALTWPQYDVTCLQWIRVTMTDKPYKVDCIKPLRACKTLGFAFNYAGPQDDSYLFETLGLAQHVQADYVQVRPALKFHGETVDIAPPAFTHPLMQVTEYKFEEAKVPHGTHYKTCEAYHVLTPFVWENADVDVCAYMRKHDGYRLGNLYKQSLKEILDSAPASVPVHKNCQTCCKLHEANLMIHRAREVEDESFP
jgi:MoaA/NifB/PqqE/SkfB family radical SAM enzyme